MQMYLITFLLASAVMMTSGRVLPTTRGSDTVLDNSTVVVNNASNANNSVPAVVVKNGNTTGQSGRKSAGVNWARVANCTKSEECLSRFRQASCQQSVTPSTNDTCCSLAASNNLTMSQLFLYNPAIDCDNLNSASVCVQSNLAARLSHKFVSASQ